MVRVQRIIFPNFEARNGVISFTALRFVLSCFLVYFQRAILSLATSRWEILTVYGTLTTIIATSFIPETSTNTLQLLASYHKKVSSFSELFLQPINPGELRKGFGRRVYRSE